MRALLFVPGSVSPESVEVDVAADGLHLPRGIFASYAAIQVASGAHQAPGTLQLEWDRHALTIQGADIERLRAAAPPEIAARIAASDTRSRRGQKRGVFLALAVVLGIPLTVYALKEPLIDAAVAVTPTAVDAKIGDLMHATLSRVDSGPAVEGVRAIGARLLATAPPHDHNFRFEVVKNASINAFAAPGGVVVVHTGLIAAARSPEELAGVMAHEITHVLHRHSMRQLVFKLGVVAAFEVLIGGADGLAGLITEAGLVLSDLGFSRDQERDADDGGLALLKAAKIPGEGMASFFDHLADKEGAAPALLSTHPASKDRAETLRARITAWEATPIEVDWKAMQASATGTTAASK